MEHRSVKLPFSDAPRGLCRWCGEKAPSGRHRWHPECAKEYCIQKYPQDAYRFLMKRDGRKCANCQDTKNLDRYYHLEHTHCVDHIVPLIDGGSTDPENLQLLCVACHVEKTSQEATERANKRKEQSRKDANV